VDFDGTTYEYILRHQVSFALQHNHAGTLCHAAALKAQCAMPHFTQGVSSLIADGCNGVYLVAKDHDVTGFQFLVHRRNGVDDRNLGQFFRCAIIEDEDE
jgi:hypothetical protein